MGNGFRNVYFFAGLQNEKYDKETWVICGANNVYF